jgi:hypothetical protein
MVGPLKTYITVTVHALVQQEQEQPSAEQGGVGARWVAPTLRLRLAEEEVHCKCSRQSGRANGEFGFENTTLRLTVPTLHRKPILVSVEDLDLTALDPLSRDKAKKASKKSGSVAVRGFATIALRPAERSSVEVRCGKDPTATSEGVSSLGARAGDLLVGMLQVSVGIESEPMTVAEVKKLQKEKRSKEKSEAKVAPSCYHLDHHPLRPPPPFPLTTTLSSHHHPLLSYS